MPTNSSIFVFWIFWCYRFIIGCAVSRGRPISFSFSARNGTICRFSAFYFLAENRWRIFGFILCFGLIIHENCRKIHWADRQMKFWNLSTSRLQLQQACMQRDWPCISRWPPWDGNRTAQIIHPWLCSKRTSCKSRHFELSPGANRRVRRHCSDNETHSTLANKRCQRAAI